MKEVDALIGDEDSFVVLAMKLSKNQAGWTMAGRRGRIQSKPRILAITAKRHPQAQRYKVKIYIIKPTPQGLELLKPYRLSSLSSIELVSSDTSGRSFLLIFDEKKDNSVPQWTTSSIDDRNQLLVVLLKMCRENLKTLPRVVGIDVVEIALWAKSNAKPLPMGAGALMDGDESLSDDRIAEESMVAQESLVSKVEEEDMEALLGRYVIGIDEAEAFSERLKRELGALEAANVHAILESETLVKDVLLSLDDATEHVQDMEHWLNEFNVKLRRMREDIEQIEAQNNMLEVQAVNNNALLQELEALLSTLVIPPQCHTVLSSSHLDEGSLPEVLSACDWLTTAIVRLEPPSLDQGYSQMRAVREKKAELLNLKTAFVRRASDHLRKFFSLIVDSTIAEKKLSRGPDHKDLRMQCRVYSSLLHALKDLEPKAAVSLRKAYATTLNLLIRREVREYSMDLRTCVRVGGRGGGGGPFLEGSSAVSASSSDVQAVIEAYRKLLNTFIPFITEEVTFIRTFLAFTSFEEDDASDSKEAESLELATTAEQLFDGIQEDFLATVDWGYRVDPLCCISMAGLTDSTLLLGQQKAEGGGGQSSDGITQVSRKLLLELQTRIRELFFKYVEDANSQLLKFDRGTKQSGVLPFIPRFATLAAKMEGMVLNNCRDLVDLAYNKLVVTMFAMLEKIAQLDPKHADVLLLENHAAFQNSTYELATAIAPLRSFYQQAGDAYENACTRYIESIIFTQFDKLFEYQQHIISRLQTIESEEIPFQIGLSKTDLRKVLKVQLVTPDRSLSAMLQRIKKHLTSADLLPPLWQKCEDDFMAKYEALESLIQRCYANESISPSSTEMRKFFKSIAP